jgi:hypothetical protein
MQTIGSRLGALLLAAGLSGAPAGAQAPDGPDVFGTQDEGITVIGYQDFLPTTSSVGYGSNEIIGTRWINGVRGLWAPITLPNGSLLTQLVAYIHDVSGADNVVVWLCRDWIHSASGASPGSDCLRLQSAGSPGDTYLQVFPNLPILYRQDVDGDGVYDVVSYHVEVFTGSSDTAIRMVRLRWKRQVSPAPNAASFNDVPTNDPAFQFIEALVASGITAGCGGGNYCPDASLTRRQMAVFLAKALGLHWPWDAQ